MHIKITLSCCNSAYKLQRNVHERFCIVQIKLASTHCNCFFPRPPFIYIGLIHPKKTPTRDAFLVVFGNLIWKFFECYLWFAAHYKNASIVHLVILHDLFQCPEGVYCLFFCFILPSATRLVPRGLLHLQ